MIRLNRILGDEWEAGEYVLEVHSDGTSKNERVCANGCQKDLWNIEITDFAQKKEVKVRKKT